jgi:hypothetical protein
VKLSALKSGASGAVADGLEFTRTQELIIVIFFYTMTKNLTLFSKKPGKVIGGGCLSI